MLYINLEQKRKSKGSKRKSGESSTDQDEIERDNNTDIMQSSQEEGLRDNKIEELGQEEVPVENDTEDPEEIIKSKERKER